MKEILHQRMWETNSYKAHEDHMMLYEALEKSMNRDHTDELLTDLAKARRKKKRDMIHQKHHMGLYLISHLLFHHQQSDHSKSTAASSSSKTAASAEYTAWTTTNIRLRLSVSSIPADLHMDDDTAPDEQVYLSDDEDIRNAHIPKVNLQQDWWKSHEEDRPATPEPAWSIQSSNLRITELKPQDLEGPAFNLVKVFHPKVIYLQYQIKGCHKLLTDRVDESIIRYNVSKALPLGSPPGQVTIQYDFFFNKDLEYLRYGSKGGRHALSISKMKAAYYPDVRLEQMVPDQMWIKMECKYDIVAIIEVFSMYGYDYMKKIVFRRADLNEHIMAERDFKYLYLSSFEDLYLLNLQEDFQLEIESYQTQLNLTKPRWDAISFEYKHDFTLIDSPRAITFRDKYEVHMIMRFNEIHKFSDGTLHQIDEALDY
uniref:Uncharacterized protein n=1 Tax=Tanacetum cinerariifolium TaxID=118510 RepID=A0A6L2JX15_TANCI|nr:hypothetical protein [Tanacetum cinerariifolium]